ncbi:helix-turn-helix domain-containing protein [Mucilaginibacter auburnensis]|uniref:Putative Tic20 family protein n=1 Tax=Mucilaginibacter auburnensis TaxID=1457233 RepID=A0A2H9VNK7_9SPHI|nr:helix-turn-helix domain-containing protein [Mucilaginibacter auburnensis]PJJ79929.1 putative Tic20 family protein [Mucilaginibacter auburnensis]
MKDNIIGEKIKSLRIAQGFSQAELANQTALSLRTIQRIENSETEARGDSLIRLSKALNVTPAELTKNPVDINAAPRLENNSYLLMLNLSAICFLAFPLLGVIAPLVLWSLKKGSIYNIDLVAKRVINFQISWVLCGIFLWVIAVILTALKTNGIIDLGSTIILFSGVFAMYAINLTYIITNTIILLRKRTVVYQPAINFF